MNREPFKGRWPQYGGGPERNNCALDALMLPLYLAWKGKTEHYIHDSPLVAEGRVYAGSSDCTYRCWSLSDGREAWRHEMDPKNEERLGAIVENDPMPEATCVTENVVVVGSSLGYLQSLMLDTGTRLWCKKLSGTCAGTLLHVGDHVVCSARRTEPEESLLVSVDPISGEIVWKKQLDMRCMSLAAQGSTIIAVLEAGKVITVKGPGKAYSRTCVQWGRVAALAVETGEELWRREFPDHGMVAELVIYGDTAIAGADGRGDIYALSLKDGSIQWKIPGQRMDASPAVANGRLYIASHDLYAYDLATRELLWQTKEGTHYYQSAPLVAGDYIFIGAGQDTGIHCRSAETGELLWTHDTEDFVFSTPAIVDGRLLIGSHDGYLYCFEGATG